MTTVDSRSAVAEPDASGLAGATRRVCAWCQGPIPLKARRDSVTCSVRCRQARHRFGRSVGRARSVADGQPLRLASGPDGPVNADACEGQLGVLDWLVEDGLLGADQVVPRDVLLAEDEAGCE